MHTASPSVGLNGGQSLSLVAQSDAADHAGEPAHGSAARISAAPSSAAPGSAAPSSAAQASQAHGSPAQILAAHGASKQAVPAAGCSAEALPGRRSGGLHRVREVRSQQGLSLRTVSRRTGIEVKELRRQEEPTTDLTLSELRLWQKALDVPLVDLLEDESQSLSRPVNERAKMVRIMKTVVSLSEACSTNVRTARLTTMLREQLLELMPELKEISGWPQCGSRRGADVMGRIFHQPISAVDNGD